MVMDAQYTHLVIKLLLTRFSILTMYYKLGMTKILLPNGEPETRTRFDWGIPRLTGDGDGDGEYPNKKSGDGDGDGDIPNPRPWTRPRYILIYKSNTKHIFIVPFIIHKI